MAQERQPSEGNSHGIGLALYVASSSNACNVNNNGNANNNNANNSNGLAPDFVNPATRDGSQIVVTDELDLYERRNTSRGESPKLPFDAITRTLLA